MTKLQKQGLTKCQKCEKLISEFGESSYYGNIFSNGTKKELFNKVFHICLNCGNELFNFLIEKT